MTTTSVDDRLNALEAEVAQIKEKLATNAQSGERPWWKKIVGIYKDDPEFEEAMRLGREYRESLRPRDDEDAS